jgi:hypothetical protein
VSVYRTGDVIPKVESPPEQRAKASPSGITTGEAQTGQFSGKCTISASELQFPM